MSFFYPWRTDYQRFRKHFGKKEVRGVTFEEFFERRLRDFAAYNTKPFRLYAEREWMRVGEPYYNIHPQLVSHLAKVDLTKIPCELVELPAKYPAINIRFCEQHPDFTLTEVVKSSLIPAGVWVQTLLMLDCRRLRQPFNMIFFVIDYGTTRIIEGQEQPTYGIFPLNMEPGQSLAEAVAVTSRAHTGGDVYQRVAENCLRLAVTVGFMASSSSELVDPDVLAEYRDEYLNAATTTERRQSIVEKSRRKKGLGWNVGNDLMFIGEAGFRTEERAPGEGRGELQWAHIRGGHLHAVRFGPNFGKVKIKWFRPTVVRDDLPFKSEK